jgi:hypothetical protein
MNRDEATTGEVRTAGLTAINVHASGGISVPWQATSPEVAGNPYAPPRAHVGLSSIRDESDVEALRWKLAPLESFAKAVGNLCISYAILFGPLLVLYHAAWVILAKLSAISTPWPYNDTVSIIAIALGVPVGVSGVIAGYGLRQLQSWSSWALWAFALSLFWQFLLSAHYDYQRVNPQPTICLLVIAVMLLVPIAAISRLDLGAILSDDFGRVVANTPHILVRAKLPLAVKCIMGLLLSILIGLFWAM